jgi:HlyD family secretion protein
MLKRFLARVGSFFSGLFRYAQRHKVQAGVAVLALLAVGWWGYGTYAKSVTTTQYVLAATHIAPIQQTVTGSGQVASEHQLNLSPKASGTLTGVYVKAGQQVAAGMLIATVDNTDAEKSLRDAQTSLESARISYLQSQSSNQNTTEKARAGVFATSATVYSDINTTLSGIDTIMQGNEVSGSYAIKNVYAYSKLFNDAPEMVRLRDQLIADDTSAKSAYQSAYADYNAMSRTADPSSAAHLAGETYAAAQATAQVAKDLNDYLNAVKARYAPTDSSAPAALSGHITSSLSYLSTSNTDVSSALGAKNDIETAIQAAGTSGDATLSEASAQLTYQKAQNAYQDAKDALANYVVRAPFAGTIAQVSLQKYDQAGASATVAVLVTKQQIATLSLNEVDAAKVKVGQPVSLTFDAVNGLTVNGSVAEVDTVGTVSQGVVSYTVKIGFDTDDARILPGMTVNATITTASKDNALVVPSSAVKTTNGQSYVEVASYTAPGFGMGSSTREASTSGQFRRASSTGAFGISTRTFATGAMARAGGPTVDASSVTVHRVPVTLGITNDTMDEITSGLTPGEFVVSQSLNASGKATAQTPSVLNLFGPKRSGTGAGGAARASGGNATFRAGPGGG